MKVGISGFLLVGLGAMTLSTVVIGCGDAGRQRGNTFLTASTATAPGDSGKPDTVAAGSGSYLRGDEDGDGDTYDDYDDLPVLDYGRPASDLERLEVSTLVTGYLRAAARSDGPAACGLLSSRMRNMENLIRDIPIEYSPGPHSRITVRKSCAYDMSRLFKNDHRALAEEVRSLHVSAVRVSGGTGFAILSFTTRHERKLAIARQGRAWKIGAPLDTELP